MENHSNKSSKNAYESQSFILKFNENVKQFSQQQNSDGDDVDYQIYRNTIKFTAAIPQVNKKKL